MAADLAHLYVEKVKKGEIVAGDGNIITLTASTTEKQKEFETELNKALIAEIADKRLPPEKAAIAGALTINGKPRVTVAAEIGPAPPSPSSHVATAPASPGTPATPARGP
jgi:hypothetical protein